MSSSKESNVTRELSFTSCCPDDISHPLGHVLLLQSRSNCSTNYPCKASDVHTAWNFVYPIARNMACKTVSSIGGPHNTSGFGNHWCLLLQGTASAEWLDFMWYLGNIRHLKQDSFNWGKQLWVRQNLIMGQTKPLISHKFPAKPSWCCILYWEYQLLKTTLFPHTKGFQKQAGWSCSTLSAKAKNPT